MVGDDRTLQALEDLGIALECIEPSAIFDDARGQCGVEAEIGADVEHDRTLSKERTKHTYDIGLVLPTKNMGKRVERAQIDADVFPGMQMHQRPVAADRDWPHALAGYLRPSIRFRH